MNSACQIAQQTSHPFPRRRSGYEHAAPSCDRTDVDCGCGERTEAGLRGCFDLHHQFTLQLTTVWADQTGIPLHFRGSTSKVTFTDEPVQGLWKPHGGLGDQRRP